MSTVQPIKLSGKNGRIAIVDAVRTPFVRIATDFKDFNAIDLGVLTVKELVKRNNLNPRDIEQLIFGMTVMIPEAPFIGREIALACGYKYLDAYSVTRACATSFQTAASLADNIFTGYTQIGIAGGTDSTSSVRIPLSAKLSNVLRDINFAKTTMEKVRLLTQLSAKDLLPQRPSITEYSVGENMGQSTEKMVKKWGISREEQDDLAHASHTNASRAIAEGWLADQILTVELEDGRKVSKDNLIRANSVRESYNKLKPLFDTTGTGTVTAGNSSPLTDGAGALLMMSEDKAKALGYTPLGYIRSYAFAAKSPQEDLLMGPVLAVPLAMDRAGLVLSDLTLVDMHEAFAGQVLSNLRGLNSDSYFQEHMGRDKAFGEIDPSILNVTGGSLAFGHPFGATGARVIMQMLNSLKRVGGGFGLTTACAAGGVGVAMVLEVE